MTHALHPNGEPLPGFRCIRRVGRSAGSETWVVQSPDQHERALKVLFGASNFPTLHKLTACRHPFLMNWDRCEVMGDDLFLLSDWTEETVHKQLKARQAEGEPGLSRSAMLRILEEAAEVLDFLHEKYQLSHGALKLNNLGVLHRHLKLLDWGLIQADKLRDRPWSVAELAVTGPEVVGGELLPASDQYALAALYVLTTTGQPPFVATSLADWFRSGPRAPQGLAQLSETERNVLTRALAAEPGQRFATCHDFAVALGRAVQDTAGAPVVIKSVEVIAATRVEPSPVAPPAPVAKLPEPVITPAPVDPPVASTVPTSVIHSYVESEDKEHHPDSAFLNLHSLAYHATVDSRGVLTPTLVIGLGGQGVAALQQLALQFQERFGGVDEVPNIRLLGLDTDAKALARHVTGKPGGLTKDQILSCRLASPGGYLWQEQQLKNVDTWLTTERIDLIGPNADPQRQRCLGRLAFVGNYRTLRERVVKECQAMLQSKAIMEATKKTGLPVRQDLTPAVYVVTGLGGAVAGSVADLAYLVRAVLVEMGWSHAHVTGLFFLPEKGCVDQEKANAYASLLEVNHYSEEKFFHADYPGGDLCHATHAPFDEGFFCQATPATGEVPPESVRRAAYWLLRDLTSPLGTLRHASRQVTGADSSAWRSHGLAALQSSAQLLTYYGKRSLVQRLIARWIHPTTEVINEVKEDGEHFLWQYVQSQTAVLERFEHVAAVVLAREPSSVIEEWVAPLRKGAAARPPLEVIARDILVKVETYFGAAITHGQCSVLEALQADAEQISEHICSHIPALINQYLDRPGYRLGACLCLGRMLLDWISEQFNELQAKHEHIRQEMVRAERTITQMSNQEERTFAAMGRLKNLTAITQDLIDYPSWVLREEMFARCLFIFQRMKETISDSLARLEPGEQSLQQIVVNSKTQLRSQEVAALGRRVLLDGHKTLEERVNAMLDELPDDFLRKLDNDLARSMGKFQTSYADICKGQGPAFQDVLNLIDTAADEALEGLVPPEDAAEQLLQQPSQTVVQQMRDAYRDARPQLVRQLGSREGAFCLLVTPPTDAGQDLVHMAESTLPQIISAPQGPHDEILFYRETGPLQAIDLYPEGRDAYDALAGRRETSPHSRFDVAAWRSFNSPRDERESDAPSELMFEMRG
jgi:hypothetical protein